MGTETDLARYADSGLFSVPSAHGDVVFADLVSRACRELSFDIIAVELPYSLNPAQVARAVARQWPTPGFAVYGGERRGQARLPEDTGAARGGKRPREVLGGSHIIPLVPSDSIVAAVWTCHRLWRRGRAGVKLDFVDLPVGATEPRSSPGVLPDTWLVARSGLPAYLASSGRQASGGRLPGIDDARELEMARRLRLHIDAGRRILFVCGLAHWDRIVALLDSPCRAAEPVAKPPDRATVRTFSLPAPQCWFLGWMGIPAIIAENLGRMEGTEDGHLDIPASVTRLALRAADRARQIPGDALSARDFLAYQHYLASQLAMAGRWTPRLDEDLHHAAEACVGERWANTLKEIALSYPDDAAKRAAPEATLIEHEGRRFLVAGDAAYELGPDGTGGEAAERRYLPTKRTAPGPEELKEAERLPCLRSIPAEDKLHKDMIEHAWRLGSARGQRRRRHPKPTRTARFSGDLGRGIDWRRTARALAEGESPHGFYVRIATRHARLPGSDKAHAESGPGIPPGAVAWIFDPTGKIRLRAGATMSGYYSSFYWLSDSVSLPGRITRETVAYCVNTLRGFSDPDERSVNAAIRSLPPRRRAKVTPWSDEELSAFEGPDLAVAAAVKYAGASATVIADHDFSLGFALRKFAAERGVEFVRIPWAIFGADARHRLALQHTAPSKTPYSAVPAYVMRAIPPVPPFSPAAARPT